MSNPWNLTPRQAQVMDAIVSTGCNKRAADALGLSHYTICSHMRSVIDRMGMQTYLQRALAWDRWRRGQG
jgi:FixJ family two-component response regulator